MNIYQKYSIFLFFLFKFVFNQNGIITLPFKKVIQDLKGVLPKDIISKLASNIIMTEIRVGTESQKIKLRLEFENYIFYIAGKNSSSEIEFDQKKSKTYKELNKKEIIINKANLKEAILSSDYIYYDKNSKKKYNTTFLLGIKTYPDQAGGLIGLNLEDEKEIKEYEKYNFINEIKRIGLIKDFYFTIIYTDNQSGNLIIGDLPHNYNKNYKKENYMDIYADFSENDLTWKIKFDEIYIGRDSNLENKEKVQDYAYCYFRIEKNIIEGTKYYREALLKSFMNEQINNNLCFQLETNVYYSYYCKKDADISKMDNIYFYNKKLGYTFELTYKDLFYYNEYDGNYYFLIVFSSDQDEDSEYNDLWILGEPFFKKYQFIFNKSSKRIGIYTYIDKNNNNGPSWASKNKWYIILIILLIILFIILAGLIIVFLKNKPKRKKIANELDDEFDYSSDKNRLVGE